MKNERLLTTYESSEVIKATNAILFFLKKLSINEFIFQESKNSDEFLLYTKNNTRITLDSPEIIQILNSVTPKSVIYRH